MGTEVKGNTYSDEFIPYVIRWGRLTNLLGFITMFGPVLVLAAVYGICPSLATILAGAVQQWSVSGVFWFVEPISYFPILGIPGTYMAFLAGNIANLRLPCAASAQEAAGVESGTEQGAIISTLGVAVSVLVNIVILALAIVAGASIIQRLPPNVSKSLNYILPALFGAVFAQFSVAQPKLAVVAFSIATVMTLLLRRGVFAFLPGGGSYVVTLTAVFGTIFVARLLHSRGAIK
ncbi:MAG: hypothetical protein ACPLPR_06095 [Bacillota bacterium]